MVTPSTQSRIVEASGDGVVERIQSRCVADSFYGSGFDFVAGVKIKFNS